MKNLAVITPYYKRTELTKLCFKSLERQSKKFGFKVFVCGDDDNIVPKSFKVVECENNPLGDKNNALIQATKEFDAVTIIGSDDFVSDSIFELFATLDLSKEVFYGFDNCHIYSAWHNKLGTDLAYSKSGNTIGVARLWTKPTLEKMNYVLWTAENNSGLDGDSKSRMLSKGIKEISLPYGEHFLIDVKQDLNITSPDLINTCDTIHNLEMIVEMLGDIGKEILNLPVGKTKQIKREKKINKNQNIYFNCEVIKDFHGFSKGDILRYNKDLAKQALKIGLIKIIQS